MKKIGLLAAVVISVLALAAGALAEKSPMLESQQLRLTLNETTGVVTVENLQTGIAYLSNPENAEADTIAKGLSKQELASQLSVTMIDSNNQQTITNTAKECLEEGGITVVWGDREVTVIYSFAASGFQIPIQYILTEDAFEARILTDAIIESEEKRIVSISLLPHFGAAPKEEAGYFFVPDGSGCLIAFGGETAYLSYNQPIYGRDPALATLNQSETKQKIYLPVFGMQREQGGFTAIVTEGAAHGFIACDKAGKKTSYNSAYAGVRCIQSETERFMEGTASATDMPVYSAFMPPECFAVRYIFLEKDQNTWVDMANVYTAYLNLTEKSFPETYGAMLNLYGAIPCTQTFLGIPYTAARALTTTEAALKIATELKKESGAALTVRYIGWMPGGLETKSTVSFNAQRGLGDMKKLSQALAEEGIGFAPSEDLANLYHAGNGFSGTFDTVKNINRSPAYQYRFLASTGSRNKSFAPWFLLKPERAAKAVKEYAENANKAGYSSVAISGITHMVYTDYDRRNGVTRDQALSLINEALSAASEQAALTMESPAGYALEYADVAVDVPVGSSGFDVEKEPVPFYQTVLSGKVPCYSQPLNLRGDMADYLLKCISFNTMPAFSLMDAAASQVVGTHFSYLYSIVYKDWKTDVAAILSEYGKKLSGTVGQRITGYETLSDRLTVTRYENGISVYVNRSKREATAQGVLVPAMDFVVVR